MRASSVKTVTSLMTMMTLRHVTVIVWFMMTSPHLSDENMMSPDSHQDFHDLREYCTNEFFNATCPGLNDVIVMEIARYGRMKTSRCTAGNHGGLGCSRDAMWYFERRCSGRNRCRVFVANPNLMQLKPCKDPELTPYLEAKYHCVTAATGSTSSCRHKKHVPLLDGVGYISSELAMAKGIGTAECPFQIHVGQGQRIQLTLMFFTGKRMSDDGEETPGTYNPDACFEIGNVYTTGSPSKKLTACGSNNRMFANVLHRSEGNNLTLQLHGKLTLQDLSPFVIKYESYGCQALVVPTGVWVRASQDTALIGCEGSDQELWTLTCNGTRWVGTMGNCSTQTFPHGASAATQPDDTFPYGILVVVAIGVALGVFIGGTLLTIVAFCMKRNGRQDNGLTGDCLSAEMIDDIYTRSDVTSVIPDLRGCTLHNDRRYRLTTGHLTAGIAGYPSLSDQTETLATVYDDQDVILCRTGKVPSACTAVTAQLLQPTTVTGGGITTGHRSLHLYETPQFG